MARTQPRGGQILDNSVKLDAPEQDVIGTLPVGNGGTGVSSVSTGSLLLGAGTAAMTEVAPGTEGNILQVVGGMWTSQTISTGKQRTFAYFAG